MHTGHPIRTIRNWLSGHRVMPAVVCRRLADALRARAEADMAVVARLEAEADRLEKRGRIPRGFEVVRERNGVVKDGRPR